MKKDSKKMREVIDFLRGYEIDLGAVDRDSRKMLGEKLVHIFGAEYVGEGMFSYVYEVAGFIVKISDDDFSSLKNLRRTKEFNEFAPKIYWTHHQGFAVVCEKVKIEKFKVRDEAYSKAYMKVMEAFKPLGLEPWDLHYENLVLANGKPSVIDYGCFLSV